MRPETPPDPYRIKYRDIELAIYIATKYRIKSRTIPRTYFPRCDRSALWRAIDYIIMHVGHVSVAVTWR